MLLYHILQHVDFMTLNTFSKISFLLLFCFTFSNITIIFQCATHADNGVDGIVWHAPEETIMFLKLSIFSQFPYQFDT